MTADNALLWLLLTALPAAILRLGFWLRSTGRWSPAVAVLVTVAVPALLTSLVLAIAALTPGGFR